MKIEIIEWVTFDIFFNRRWEFNFNSNVDSKKALGELLSARFVQIKNYNNVNNKVKGKRGIPLYLKARTRTFLSVNFIPTFSN